MSTVPRSVPPMKVNIILGYSTETSLAPPAEIGKFGAKNVNDLSGQCDECLSCNRMEVYFRMSCESDGKKLPRKHDGCPEIALKRGGNSIELASWIGGWKITSGDYIPKRNWCLYECNACVKPVLSIIDPLSIILQMRSLRVAMEWVPYPAQWKPMFQKYGNQSSPW